MDRLPHWVIRDNNYALYDSESVTAIESVNKLYHKMNELIDDYNSFVDKVNNSIDEFENGLEKDYEVFTTELRQEFQDFIDIVDLKIIKQDDVINDAVKYMKDNLHTSIQNILTEMRNNGELVEDLSIVFNDILSGVEEITSKHNNDIATVVEDIDRVNILLNDNVQRIDEDINSINLTCLGINETVIKNRDNIIKKADKLPSLTDAQKLQIQNLMKDYFSNRLNMFLYANNVRRETYANIGEVNDVVCDYILEYPIYNDIDKNIKWYTLNCSTFVQFIMMGRNISDFTDNREENITTITKYFDWGYYFDFIESKYLQNVKNETKDEYYTANTYINKNGDTRFITYDNAASMARELYNKGCEINYNDLEIGDIIFYRDQMYSSTGEYESDYTLENINFRNISHVAIVYDVDENGVPIFMECADGWQGDIGRYGLTTKEPVSATGRRKAISYCNRVVMCARNPSALGYGDNVPNEFTHYRATLSE